MKLSKKEKEQLQIKIELLSILKKAEASWTPQRLKEEIEEFGHQRKMNRVRQEIREYRLKELGI